MAAQAKPSVRTASGSQPARRGTASEGGELAVGSEGVLEIQRARMVAAMLQECCERGSENVTVAHVVARAGVSRRTFYELFADRDECFLATFDDAMRRARSRLLEAYDPDAEWAERVRGGLIAILRFGDADPRAARLLLEGSLAPGSKAQSHQGPVMARMTAVIDEGRMESKTARELSALIAEGVVGGVLSVLCSRLFQDAPEPLVKLTGPLMSMIVLPYFGPKAAREELARPNPPHEPAPITAGPDSLSRLGMRLTYRTICVLLAVAATPGASNRSIAEKAGITDQGQISKLLNRLNRIGLIENTSAVSLRGAPNAWVLTSKGWEVQGALGRQAA